ncbi:sulfite exporter TauE/SafE family protein [Legionella waltersii]|uniref:Probable membrane transporter protein n=1 Tax=Legionella waltersii TaxID=66969 RepID=A0A0W1A4Y6_9GAMM|nr:sulfite exporter TauE/SafE family protein [Legionella waltersii]KTD76374.1 permease [Legionella waltersii]SNV14030.1 permease [Legionella waltersii]
MTMIIFQSLIAYMLIGLFAGVMSGSLGIGGGIIVVPGLVTVFQQFNIIPEDSIMHVAAGCSLAAMILSAMASLRAHIKVDDILWAVFKRLWPGILIGTILGSILASFIDTEWLEIIFGLFLICIAIKLFIDVHATHDERFPRTWVNHFICSSIGGLSGLLGVGGGVMIIPYLTYCGVAVRKISAVSSLCVLVVGFIGSTMFMLTGAYEMKHIPYSTGFIYWPAVLGVAIPSSLIAPYGAKLNYILPIKYLRYGFIVVLIVTATHMLL